jgi:hypothetical protein
MLDAIAAGTKDVDRAVRKTAEDSTDRRARFTSGPPLSSILGDD